MQDEKGYFVVRSVRSDLTFVDHIGNFDYIFNHVEESKNDYKRSQCILQGKAASVVKEIAASYFPSHDVHEIVLVRSDPGCQQQPPHTDYDPHTMPADGPVPMSLLLCCSEQCSLYVWPYSHLFTCNRTRARDFPPELRKTKLILNKGDAVFFRGDLVHAGAEYDEENFRIHAYLDMEGVQRTQDTTFLRFSNPHMRGFLSRESVH